MADTDVLIVGAGHGGAQAAIALRLLKFPGRITLIGEETDLPYERPPLSKEYLAGVKSFERLLIRPPNFWTERDITVIGGTKVVSVDASRKTVRTAEMQEISYQQLVWAAGGRARTLNCPGSAAEGVHTIRSRSDADSLVSALPSVSRVVVVGGGYIGLEAAAVLRKLGKSVTLLEASNRVLSRVAGEQLSRFYEAEHRAHGVDVRLDSQLESLQVSEGRVRGVRLNSGEIVQADLVIVGIGMAPNAEPLIAAGASGGNGVRVDEFCRTSLPDVFAIGDVALHASPWCEQSLMRLESVQNAADMAGTVARAIIGSPEPYTSVPWFWSIQYDLKLQTVGLSVGHDEVVLRGDMVNRSFSLIYLKTGKVIAIDTVNAMKDFVQGKALVQARSCVSTERLRDASLPLKDAMTA